MGRTRQLWLEDLEKDVGEKLWVKKERHSTEKRGHLP
jgi:hypothetical protein